MGWPMAGSTTATVIHELLHNVGVGHPHDGFATLPGVSSPSGDTGDFALNQNLYTVMSYNRVTQYDHQGQRTTGHPFSTSTVDHSFGVLGAFDIAIVQTLYGANMQHATGNNVYVLPKVNQLGTYFKSIWDAGGVDELRHTGAQGATLDLRAATLDPADGMLAGGALSRAIGINGGFTIARSVVIENATGGSGHDMIIGNSAANRLRGRGRK